MRTTVLYMDIEQNTLKEQNGVSLEIQLQKKTIYFLEKYAWKQRNCVVNTKQLRSFLLEFHLAISYLMKRCL
jgi:hypothetical protein